MQKDQSPLKGIVASLVDAQTTPAVLLLHIFVPSKTARKEGNIPALLLHISFAVGSRKERKEKCWLLDAVPLLAS